MEKKDFRKLYEDIVKSEWFKKAYHNKSLGECPFVIDELEESEDERIRKVIVKHFEDLHENSFINLEIPDILAWLEKQKESLHIPEPCKENADSFTDDKEMIEGIELTLHCYKQWIDGSDLMLQSQKDGAIELIEEQEAWLAKQKATNSEKPKEWSEEANSIKRVDAVVAFLAKYNYITNVEYDSNKKRFIISILRHEDDFWLSDEYKHCREILGDYYYAGNFGGDKFTLYVLLRSPKIPIQFSSKCVSDEKSENWLHNNDVLVQEWSDEDEKMLNKVLDSITYAFYDQGNEGEIEDDPAFLWLHRLRPQPHWKPSEEQMEALKKVAFSLIGTGTETDYILASLYDDLKKLNHSMTI